MGPFLQLSVLIAHRMTVQVAFIEIVWEDFPSTNINWTANCVKFVGCYIFDNNASVFFL